MARLRMSGRIGVWSVLASFGWLAGSPAHRSARGEDLGAPGLERVEIRNVSKRALVEAQCRLQDSQGKVIPLSPKDEWYTFASAGVQGYGPRVPDAEGRTGFTTGTTILGSDPCDSFRAFVPKGPALDVRSIQFRVKVGGEFVLMRLCVAAGVGCQDPPDGAFTPAGLCSHKNLPTRPLRKVTLAYLGLDRCRTHHRFEVFATWHGGPCERDSRRWYVLREVEGSEARLAGGLPPAYQGPRQGEQGLREDDEPTPGAPKPFTDFELRNKSNGVRIKKAIIRGHDNSPTPLFVTTAKQIAGPSTQARMGDMFCGSGTVKEGFGKGPALCDDYNGADHGNCFGEANITDLCRRFTPLNQPDHLYALLLEIEWETDAAAPAALGTTVVCITESQPGAAACMAASGNPAVCTLQATDRPLHSVLVTYMAYNDDTDTHTLRIRRTFYEFPIDVPDTLVSDEDDCTFMH